MSFCIAASRASPHGSPLQLHVQLMTAACAQQQWMMMDDGMHIHTDTVSTQYTCK